MKPRRKSRRKWWGRRKFKPNLIHMERWEEEVILRKISELDMASVSYVELDEANPGLFNVTRLTRVLARLSKRPRGSSAPTPLVRKRKVVGFGRGRFYYELREQYEARKKKAA